MTFLGQTKQIIGAIREGLRKIFVLERDPSYVIGQRIADRFDTLQARYGSQFHAFILITCEATRIEDWTKTLQFMEKLTQSPSDPHIFVAGMMPGIMEIRAILSRVPHGPVTEQYEREYMHILDTFESWIPLQEDREYHYTAIEF